VGTNGRLGNTFSVCYIGVASNKACAQSIRCDQGIVMLAQRVSIQRVKIWSIGFTVLFGLLVFLAVLFTSYLLSPPYNRLPVLADDNQAAYLCAASGLPTAECSGDHIFIADEDIFFSLYALGLLALTCLTGLFLTESKLMWLGVFPLQLLSMIIACILLICGTPLIIYKEQVMVGR
jgi:hypothetical protein